MGKAGDPRNGRAYKALARQVVKDEPLCWLRYPGCTRWSDTADHVIPIKARPDLAMVRSNMRGACRHCNSTRQTQPAVPVPTPAQPALAWFDDA